MIISASYKTDIPTFYGEWFMNRLQAGYCKMVNPYGRQIYTIDLSSDAVDGFVFWTKNIGPFLKYLPEIRQRGYPFIVQHTINGYPRELEFRVINYTQSIEHMKRLADDYGPDVAIWRYDPIIISSLTPVDWHQRNFETLAQSLEATTSEVVVSFGQVYKKTRRNMEWAAGKFGFQWSEHEAMTWDDVRKLASELAQIASAHGMQLRVCSQQALLIPGVIEEARCVDADRLERVSGKAILGKTRQKGNRKECGCFASRDIGEYDTCPHGCVYCYAVQNRDLALQRYRAHDPASEFLFAPEHTQPGESGVSENPGTIPLAHIGKKHWLAEQPAQDAIIVQEQLFDL
ncbi:MAG TPA: DUF1848 domain-containing protein [Ktedonobacteraceae bacterium]|nr:DUF1848 domain-containing protein [Ktedonobacteraceae bacterium]